MPTLKQKLTTTAHTKATHMDKIAVFARGIKLIYRISKVIFQINLI